MTIPLRVNVRKRPKLYCESQRRILYSAGEPLDQTGTIGHLYCSRFAVARMGSEDLSNGSSTGSDSRTIETIDMQEVSFEEGLERIRAKDSRYDRDAYEFVRDALDHTRKMIGKERPGQHVSGQELLNGIRDLALIKFGPMAITVFEEWGIRRCSDFGDIVFNMIEAELLAKEKKDSRDDFGGGYDFYEAFRKPFLPAHKVPPIAESEPKATRV